jgi:hypothetical protein
VAGDDVDCSSSSPSGVEEGDADCKISMLVQTCNRSASTENMSMRVRLGGSRVHRHLIPSLMLDT